MVAAGSIAAEESAKGNEQFVAAERGLPTANMFGIVFSNITKDELFAEISKQVASGKPGYINTPNVDHVCLYHRNPVFAEAYRGSFANVADGMPVILASRILRQPLKEKISGSDLIYQLSEYAALQGHSLYLLGAAPGIGDAAAEELKRLYPGLIIKGTYSPPLGFEKDPEEIRAIHQRLQEATPDICYVALGSPKQEIWIAAQYQATGVPVHIGIGASFDFVTGQVKRAPVWMQKTSMEWFWRLCQEPRRLARRYLYDDLLFFKLLIMEWWGAKSAPKHPGGSNTGQ